MAEKPAPKPEDDTYSDEEIAKRMDATVQAMIAMKPKPHSIDRPARIKKSEKKREDIENE